MSRVRAARQEGSRGALASRGRCGTGVVRDLFARPARARAGRRGSVAWQSRLRTIAEQVAANAYPLDPVKIAAAILRGATDEIPDPPAQIEPGAAVPT